MKKLLTLTLLLFVSLLVKAQTADETLEWLKAKQPAISGNSISIDSIAIRYVNDDKKAVIEWSKVKDITGKLGQITVVGSEVINGNNVFIRFFIDYKVSDKYLKALKHLAELKGAKLVKDDMF